MKFNKIKKKLKSRIVGTAFSVNSAVYELSRLEMILWIFVLT